MLDIGSTTASAIFPLPVVRRRNNIDFLTSQEVAIARQHRMGPQILGFAGRTARR